MRSRYLLRDWQGVLKDGWRSPQVLLLIFAASIPIAFEPWSALINNFAVDVVNFTGLERGILESVREIPGFLAFTVVYMLLVWRQQTFAILALSVLGLGVALTGLLPTVWGLYFTTMVMSTGFHYLATMEQSLSMQWTSKEQLPLVLGAHGRRGCRRIPGRLRPGLCRIRVPGFTLLDRLPDFRNGHSGARTVLLDVLPAIRGIRLPDHDDCPAQTLLALLRAGVHVRGTPPDLRRLRRVPHGRRVSATARKPSSPCSRPTTSSPCGWLHGSDA